MQITSLIDILDGSLQSNPSISFIYDIKAKVSRFKEGDALISNSQVEISKALAKGAFGIIYSSEHIEVSDPEIAWIKVEDLNRAIIKLSRYFLANTKVKSFFCDELTYEMLDIWKKNHPKLVLLEDNPSKNLEKIKTIENHFTVFCYDEGYLMNILPLSKPYKIANYKIKNVVEHSLFEVSFSYKNSFYQRLKLPIIYLKNFVEALEFYGEQELQIQKLRQFKHLNPYFINKNSQIVDFGKSEKFIIMQNNKSSLMLELNYLNSRFSYGKKIFLLPMGTKIKTIQESSIIFYDSKEQIKEIINHHTYNCLYIFGIGEEKLENYLEPTYFTQSLF